MQYFLKLKLYNFLYKITKNETYLRKIKNWEEKLNINNSNHSFIYLIMASFAYKKITFEFLSKLIKNPTLKNKVKFYPYYYLIKKDAKLYGKKFGIGGISYINSNTYLSDYVTFNGMTIEGNGKVTIGHHFHSGSDCHILTSTIDYDKISSLKYSENFSSEDVEIGDFVWFGTRVIILPDTKIGEGAIIQAGAVVHGEIPPCAIVGGNPAKVFKYRDIEHYQKLKEQGKFH